VAPDAVHDLFLVATDTKTVLLAILVESTGSAVAKVIALLALTGVLDLVFLGDLLGRSVNRDRFVKAELEVIFPATTDKIGDLVTDSVSVLETVLGDEGNNAVVDSRHLENFENFINPFQGTLRFFKFL
jgi:hypothetical protein